MIIRMIYVGVLLRTKTMKYATINRIWHLVLHSCSCVKNCIRISKD